MMNGMPFRRRNSGLQPINSRKNIVQEISGIAAAATETVAIISAKDVMPSLSDTVGCTVGARVNQIYLEVWMYGAAADNVNSPITWFLWKNPGTNLTAPSPATAGISDNKKHIFAMGKGQVGNQAAGQPGYLIRGWFSVPKIMRRMGFDDEIQLVIQNSTAGVVNTCKLFIYKWYF